MKIEKVVNGSEVVLYLSGRLDTNTAVDLEQAVTELKNVSVLVLSIKDLEYVSSAGLRVILMAHKKMRAAAGSLKVQHPVDIVREVFVMTGFSDILTIEK